MREISELITESVGSHIDNMLNERLLSVLSTKENVNLETLGFSSDAVEGCQAIITPIDIAGERLGTLFIYKQDAISTLSFSELEAIIHIFKELDGTEGILVASKVADRVGITRSVIVNALRKFESAGVIESRSSGMKGTYIKVLNDYVFTELERIEKERM